MAVEGVILDHRPANPKADDDRYGESWRLADRLEAAHVCFGESLSRRRNYRDGLLAAALLPTTLAATANENPMIKAIDAHVHVWTPDTERDLLAAGFRRDEIRPASFTPDELLAHARPCGVERVVLVKRASNGFDNRYMLDAIKNYPGVFAGIAVIDDDAARPQDEMPGSAGQRGGGRFRIYPARSPGRAVARWARHGGDVVLGADDNLAMCHLVNPDALPAVRSHVRAIPGDTGRDRSFRAHRGRWRDSSTRCRYPVSPGTAQTDDGQAIGLLCPRAEDAPLRRLGPDDPSVARGLWRRTFDVGDRLSLSDRSAHV